MTAMIYLDESCRLKSFSAVTKGQGSVIKIEIACTDHFSLGYMLGELARIQADQLVKPEKPAKTKKEPQRALAAPLLQLTYDRGGK